MEVVCVTGSNVFDDEDFDFIPNIQRMRCSDNLRNYLIKRSYPERGVQVSLRPLGKKYNPNKVIREPLRRTRGRRINRRSLAKRLSLSRTLQEIQEIYQEMIYLPSWPMDNCKSLVIGKVENIN